MSLSVRMECDEIREIGFATIGAVFMGIGTELEKASMKLYVQNLTDVPLMFSENGVTENYTVWGPGFWAMDVAFGDKVRYPVGFRLYVRTIAAFGAPTSGLVYVSSFSGSED